ncbi:MAG: insulinase family protein [Patescibacteria group bacterium]|nr:insulinase family protein [Patescibacteria group bacterium]
MIVQKPIVKKLKNGLRVLLLPMPQSASVTVAVFVRAGSAYEDKHNNGISHFLEHMCFKGTQKFPRPMDIATELEQMGALYNAFTARDLTGYYAKVSPRHFKRAAEVIFDLYLTPQISKEEMEKEKGVIIEEIHMYDDDPQSKVGEELEKALYGDQPAGWNIAGTPEHVMRMNRDTFIQYRTKHYTPHNTVVVVAGAYDMQKAYQLIQRSFNKMELGKSSPRASALIKSKQGEQISIIERKLDQTHLALGFYGLPIFHKRRAHLSMLVRVLGGGMSSRLFQRVREELGAAYYVGAGNTMHATHGYLDISAGVAHTKLEQALRGIKEEVQKITTQGVSSQELKRAQDYAIGTFQLSLESSSDLGFYYGQQATVLGTTETPQQMIKKIKEVTPHDVQKAARDFLNPKTMRFSIIGPYKRNEEKKFKKLLGI